METMPRALVLFALGGLVLGGCASDLPPGGSYFDDAVAPIIEGSCLHSAGGCHVGVERAVRGDRGPAEVRATAVGTGLEEDDRVPTLRELAPEDRASRARPDHDDVAVHHVVGELARVDDTAWRRGILHGARPSRPRLERGPHSMPSWKHRLDEGERNATRHGVRLRP